MNTRALLEVLRNGATVTIEPASEDWTPRALRISLSRHGQDIAHSWLWEPDNEREEGELREQLWSVLSQFAQEVSNEQA